MEYGLISTSDHRMTMLQTWDTVIRSFCISWPYAKQNRMKTYIYRFSNTLKTMLATVFRKIDFSRKSISEFRIFRSSHSALVDDFWVSKPSNSEPPTLKLLGKMVFEISALFNGKKSTESVSGRCGTLRASLRFERSPKPREALWHYGFTRNYTGPFAFSCEYKIYCYTKTVRNY